MVKRLPLGLLHLLEAEEAGLVTLLEQGVTPGMVVVEAGPGTVRMAQGIRGLELLVRDLMVVYPGLQHHTVLVEVVLVRPDMHLTHLLIHVRGATELSPA
jgi:hypothetical protein